MPNDQIIPGVSAWFATVCRECPAGCGIIAKNRESRLIKLEGNPLHPINRGRLCMRGQAALQSLYHPDRLRKLLMHKKEIVKLFAKIREQGYTVIPLRLYFKNGMVKAEIGLAKGKKLYDKRESIARRDAEREIERQFHRRE